MIYFECNVLKYFLKKTVVSLRSFAAVLVLRHRYLFNEFEHILVHSCVIRKAVQLWGIKLRLIFTFLHPFGLSVMYCTPINNV